jgi:hypothetical protein
MTPRSARVVSFASSIRPLRIARPLRRNFYNSSTLPHQGQPSFSYSYHHHSFRPGCLLLSPIRPLLLWNLDPFRTAAAASHFQTRTFTMAAADPVSQLSVQLEQLGSLDKYPNCYPEVNPQDIYRAHITSIVHKITGVDTTIIYNALQWTLSQDKGDMVIAIPALRVKGAKPAELGEQWLAKVRICRAATLKLVY